LIADVFGVLLGGVAYARSLASLLLRPPADITTLDTQDQHPNGYVRMFFIAALLRQAGGAIPDWTAAADEMEELWRTRYGAPADLADFVAECPAVAQVLLETPLAALAGHRLTDFGATLAQDQAQANALARWLRIGLQRPDPNTFDVRLVPAASQLAIGAVV